MTTRPTPCPCGYVAEIEAWISEMRSERPDDVMWDSIPRASSNGAEGAEEDYGDLPSAYLAAKAASSQPAPDVMLEMYALRLASFDGKFFYFGGPKPSDVDMEMYRKRAETLLTLSAPVPSPDGAGETMADYKRHWLSFFNGWFRDMAEAKKAIEVAEQAKLFDPSQHAALASGTGAAEPVAMRQAIEDLFAGGFVEAGLRGEPDEWKQVFEARTKALKDSLSAAPPVRGDRSIALPSIAPHKCACCGGDLHLNGANYSCDKQSSESFHIDDLSLPSAPVSETRESLYCPVTIYRVEDDHENLWIRVPGADIATVKMNSKIGRALLMLEADLRSHREAAPVSGRDAVIEEKQ